MTPTNDELVADLDATNPDVRRRALTELRARASAFLTPSAIGALHTAATRETDEPSRRIAQLAFLTQVWRFHDFRRALPLLETAADAELAALVEAPKPAEAAAPRLAPIVLRALDAPAQRLVAMRLLEPLQRFKANVDAAIGKLLDYLDDADVRAAAAEVLRRLSPSLAAHRERFVALTTSATPEARAIGAGFLARIALAAGDESALLSLVRHDDVTVREYVVGELHAAARAGVDLRAATTALGVALSDPGGGVVYHAARALLAVASGGTELGDAVVPMTRLLKLARYSTAGWAAPMPPLFAAQVARQAPAIDAVGALVYHHLTRGDAEAIEALVARDDLSEETRLAATETVQALSEVPTKLR